MAPGCGGLKSFGNTSSPSNYKKSPKLLPVCHSLAGKSHTLTWEPQTWPARLCSRNHPPALELHRPLGRSWKAPWLAPALAVAASPPLPAASSPHTPVVHLENKVEESQTTSRYLQRNWCQLHPEAEQAYQHIIKNRAQSRQCLPEHCSATAVLSCCLNHSPACGVRGTSPCHTTSKEISPIPQKRVKDRTGFRSDKVSPLGSPFLTKGVL